MEINFSLQRRNIIAENLPELIFPHGNAKQMPLLYPIGKKDYNGKSIIKNEWNGAKDVLSRAAGITVYGYGAPVTDIEAVELMKSANNISKMKDIAPFTIINLAQNEAEQRQKWKDFYDVKMVYYCNNFEESLLWKNPRVSLETLFDAILQQQPREIEKSFKKFTTLGEIQDFVKTITEFEMQI